MQQQPNKLLPVLFGAFVITFISVFPLLNFINVICCAGIMIGGYAGVHMYNKECIKCNQQLTNKDSMFIGILAGVFSAVLVSIFSMVTTMFSDINPMQEINNMMHQFGFPSTPETDQILYSLSDEFDKHGFSPTLAIITFVINIIVYPLFAMIGALISFSVINKRKGTTQV